MVVNMLEMKISIFWEIKQLKYVLFFLVMVYFLDSCVLEKGNLSKIGEVFVLWKRNKEFEKVRSYGDFKEEYIRK